MIDSTVEATVVATKRVVIADDDPDIRALVSIAVRKAGLELVAEGSDGEAALEAVKRLRPDLAVLDVSMPTMTGLEVCRAVRADPTLDGVRLILLSAGADDQAKSIGLAAGAEEYFIKPFSPKALAVRLAALMGDTE
jgi:DNA-binding response OmpR family regulator